MTPAAGGPVKNSHHLEFINKIHEVIKIKKKFKHQTQFPL
ncbi:hypothetical protein SAMN05661099_0430 [Daejeonella lutea]|uniref:Uncharacterized protein n=1 Tax=Daejeonella lutea TaxID=572036 RepID=A0A1T5A7Z3_9SPHI|nr:hypothetical protein SAMN05661099_0430 [Daejeonella lutea]